MITLEKIQDAERCAMNFILAVHDLEKERESGSYRWERSKKSATLRRRSMDLTNALADLRRPE